MARIVDGVNLDNGLGANIHHVAVLYHQDKIQESMLAKKKGLEVEIKDATKLNSRVLVSETHNKSRLKSSRIQIQDLMNKAHYHRSSSNLDLGLQLGEDGRTPRYKNLKAMPPVVLSAKDKGKTLTRSAIVDVNIATAQDVSNLNRAEHHTVQQPRYNQEAVDAAFAITNILGKAMHTFVANRVRKAEVKEKEAKQAQNLELLSKAQAQKLNWGSGGWYRKIALGLVVASSLQVTANTHAFIPTMASTMVQQELASHIGAMIKDGILQEGSFMHATLHVAMGAAGQYVSGGEAQMGAIGSGLSSLATRLIEQPSPAETQQSRDGKLHLINSLVAGIAMGMAGAESASITSQLALDNNWLSIQQQAQAHQDLAACRSLSCVLKTQAAWLKISLQQDGLTGLWAVKEIGGQAVLGVIDVAKAMAHLPETLQTIKALITDREVRAQVGEDIITDLKVTRAQIKYALEVAALSRLNSWGKRLVS